MERGTAWPGTIIILLIMLLLAGLVWPRIAPVGRSPRVAEPEEHWCQYRRNVLADATEVAKECNAACKGELLAPDTASACVDICARRWFCEDQPKPGH